MVDSEALSGEERGQSLLSYKLLADRLAAEAFDRPVRIIWSKSDFEIPEGTKERLKEHLARNLPNASQISVSVVGSHENGGKARAHFAELLSWLLEPALMELPCAKSNPHSEDFFLGFGS
jgi:hypothetical protein